MSSAILVPVVFAAACLQLIPASFTGDRAIARMPTSDGAALAMWVDSDGSGFVFDDVAKRYAFPTEGAGGSHVRLPQTSGFPSLAIRQPVLPLLRRADVAGDAIFSGIDGQLGASWLQFRVWTFDYTRRRLLWRCDNTVPPHSNDQEAAISFALTPSGGLVSGLEYPQASVTIGGQRILSAIDTAATVALTPAAARTIGGGLPAVRATSFATKALVRAWHEQHPDWPYIADAGVSGGISAIRVAQVKLARLTFSDVWVTTRPDDDVFSGERVGIKLGPTAFGRGALTLDYIHRRAIYQPG